MSSFKLIQYHNKLQESSVIFSDDIEISRKEIFKKYDGKKYLIDSEINEYSFSISNFKQFQKELKVCEKLLDKNLNQVLKSDSKINKFQKKNNEEIQKKKSMKYLQSGKEKSIKESKKPKESKKNNYYKKRRDQRSKKKIKSKHKPVKISKTQNSQTHESTNFLKELSCYSDKKKLIE